MINGLFDGASDSLGAAGSGDQIPGFAKGKTVPEDMLRASMKSKINVGATSTEFFRDYDNVSLPSDSLGITLFSSTFSFTLLAGLNCWHCRTNTLELFQTLRPSVLHYNVAAQ